MNTTVKVTALRVGDRLTAWHAEPVVIGKPRLVNGWWKVKTDRGDVAVLHESDVAMCRVGVERSK